MKDFIKNFPVIPDIVDLDMLSVSGQVNFEKGVSLKVSIDLVSTATETDLLLFSFLFLSGDGSALRQRRREDHNSAKHGPREQDRGRGSEARRFLTKLSLSRASYCLSHFFEVFISVSVYFLRHVHKPYENYLSLVNVFVTR